MACPREDLGEQLAGADHIALAIKLAKELEHGLEEGLKAKGRTLGDKLLWCHRHCPLPGKLRKCIKKVKEFRNPLAHKYKKDTLPDDDLKSLLDNYSTAARELKLFIASLRSAESGAEAPPKRTEGTRVHRKDCPEEIGIVVEDNGEEQVVGFPSKGECTVEAGEIEVDPLGELLQVGTRICLQGASAAREGGFFGLIGTILSISDDGKATVEFPEAFGQSIWEGELRHCVPVVGTGQDASPIKPGMKVRRRDATAHGHQGGFAAGTVRTWEFTDDGRYMLVVDFTDSQGNTMSDLLDPKQLQLCVEDGIAPGTPHAGPHSSGHLRREGSSSDLSPEPQAPAADPNNGLPGPSSQLCCGEATIEASEFKPVDSAVVENALGPPLYPGIANGPVFAVGRQSLLAVGAPVMVREPGRYCDDVGKLRGMGLRMLFTLQRGWVRNALSGGRHVEVMYKDDADEESVFVFEVGHLEVVAGGVGLWRGVRVGDEVRRRRGLPAPAGDVCWVDPEETGVVRGCLEGGRGAYVLRVDFGWKGMLSVSPEQVESGARRPPLSIRLVKGLEGGEADIQPVARRMAMDPIEVLDNSGSHPFKLRK
eukprot:evm.model.scf_2427.2 EVM.evm.TU.scf_2427.2   scf_2427:11713-13494(+)